MNPPEGDNKPIAEADDIWDPKKHDKALLKSFSDHGYKDYVTQFNEANSGDKGLKTRQLSHEIVHARIESICEFFRDVAT